MAVTRRLQAVPPVLVAVIAAAAAGGAAAGAATAPKLRVNPARGPVHTTFTVHFTAPVPSGRTATEVHGYRLTAAAAHRRRGCIDTVDLHPVANAAGEAMAVRLVPRRLGGRWCAESYTGQVTETSGPACGPSTGARPAILCPAALPRHYMSTIATLGRFSFRVTR